MPCKIKKTCISIAVIILLHIFCIFVYAQPTDIEGHWAEDIMLKWNGYGVVRGSNGLYNPNSNTTRAEFVAMVSRILRPMKKSAFEFDDVAKGQWYTDYVLKATEAGFIQYSDKDFRPLEYITRQEAATILYNAFDIKPCGAYILNQYKDHSDIAPWAEIALGALVENRYMSGKPGNFLAPNDTIIRAETIRLIDEIAGELIYKAGIYTDDIEGNVVINVPGVTLKDMKIKGNLYIAHGVGDGEVTLDNVEVSGRTIVRGGNKGLYIKNSNLKGTMVVLKKDGNIKISLSENSFVNDVELWGPVVLVQEKLKDSGYGRIAVKSVVKGKEIDIMGDIAELVIEAPYTKIDFAKGTIGNLSISHQAGNTEITLAKKTTIKSATIEAKSVIIGTGTVQKASIWSDGVIMEQRPKSLEVVLGKKAMISGIVVEGKEKRSSTSGSYRPGEMEYMNLEEVYISGLKAHGDGRDFSIDLSDEGNNAELSSIKLTACQINTIFTITSITSDEETDISIDNKDYNLPITLSIKELLGASNTSLGEMRKTYGGYINIEGNLSRTGYNTSSISITINLGDDGTASD